MPFQIVRNDITKLAADAIVNTANPDPVIGGGTDQAIYDAAGREELLEARRHIGRIAPGEVAVTPAFALKAKYVIHTVGPRWTDGAHGEGETLHSCYRKALELAEDLGCESIAFPLIATGVYGFPRDEALEVALEEFSTYLLMHEKMRITLAVFDKESCALSAERFGALATYISEHYANERLMEEYRDRRRGNERYLRSLGITASAQETGGAGSGTQKIVPQGQTFQQRLLELLDASGMKKDSDFYKKAGISKQVFSTIRSDVNYQPSKETAIASALVLRLRPEDAEDLLMRAGYAFSPTNLFDLTIRSCLERGIYRIMDVNEELRVVGKYLKEPEDPS